jgi:hypothetical protein
VRADQLLGARSPDERHERRLPEQNAQSADALWRGGIAIPRINSDEAGDNVVVEAVQRESEPRECRLRDGMKAQLHRREKLKSQ